MLGYFLLGIGVAALCTYRYYRKRKEATRFEYLFKK